MHKGGEKVKNKVIIVSRHPSFFKLLETVKEYLPVDIEHAEVVEHIHNPTQIKGKIVITSGIPLSLMAMAKRVITVDLDFPRDPEERRAILEEIKKGNMDIYKDRIKAISLYKVNRSVLYVKETHGGDSDE